MDLIPLNANPNNMSVVEICFRLYTLFSPPVFNETDDNGCLSQSTNSFVKELRIRTLNTLGNGTWVEVDNVRSLGTTWDSQKMVIPLNRPVLNPIRICLRSVNADPGMLDKALGLRTLYSYDIHTCPVLKRGLAGYNCYRGATTTCGLKIPTGTSPFNPTYKSMMDTFGQKNTASVHG
ncbi:hypothetical protein HYH03_016682 [Edaphochlamys debaryana]|uniref:Uncharacterized protein n=1 Tax=Edaphochlamys debaryana TaxID=47281 RepID=A0A835XH48_9CHLO|nr:hypothetical protein HYH03_016682 [Edaphochlamys debaryana]|eukprot:KAG2484547.1 hypothetical protein HYH03_016682 [Edaphochlamys debaryana]